MSKEPLAQVIDLDFAYRDDEGWSRVLHGVNFTIFRGEAFGLVGEFGLREVNNCLSAAGLSTGEQQDRARAHPLQGGGSQGSRSSGARSIARQPGGACAAKPHDRFEPWHAGGATTRRGPAVP